MHLDGLALGQRGPRVHPGHDRGRQRLDLFLGRFRVLQLLGGHGMQRFDPDPAVHINF